MKAGKALNERKVEIRVQYKPPIAGIHPNLNEMRNELVVRAPATYLLASPICLSCFFWGCFDATSTWDCLEDVTHMLYCLVRRAESPALCC